MEVEFSVWVEWFGVDGFWGFGFFFVVWFLVFYFRFDVLGSIWVCYKFSFVGNFLCGFWFLIVVVGDNRGVISK